VTAITPEKLAELEKLEAAATPGEWFAEEWHGSDAGGWAARGPHHVADDGNDEPNSDPHQRAKADSALIVTLRHSALDLFAALREAWWETNQALARCEKLRELADVAAGEQGLAQRRMMEAQRARDKARAALDQLRTSVLSIAAQIDRAADARAAAVLIGQPPSGAATVYDLRAFAGDLRRAVEAPRDTDA
jgi:hypothetical protein